MSVLALNKRARYDYEIIETFKAGLVLSGPEVKAAKAGQASLKGSFVVLRQVKGGVEPYLLNSHIAAYRYAPKEGYETDRARKLLLKSREIAYLLGKQKEKGLTLVPLKLYTERSLIKVDFAVAQGKKKADKREDLKKRDLNRRLKGIRQSGLL
ncbi:MAG: SsrA-binding protein SmpB [Patescibacteria group bacterium]|nr:MAG: SsrA-binding protein SmpB [Patescibacteria group bacterium]